MSRKRVTHLLSDTKWYLFIVIGVMFTLLCFAYCGMLYLYCEGESISQSNKETNCKSNNIYILILKTTPQMASKTSTLLKEKTFIHLQVLFVSVFVALKQNLYHLLSDRSKMGGSESTTFNFRESINGRTKQ